MPSASEHQHHRTGIETLRDARYTLSEFSPRVASRSTRRTNGKACLTVSRRLLAALLAAPDASTHTPLYTRTSGRFERGFDPPRGTISGVAMGWAKSGAPSAGAAEFQAKKLLQGRLVHEGETFNRFAHFGL